MANIKLLQALVALLLVFGLSVSVQSTEDAGRVILLGTGGGPGGNSERAGIASLLTINDQHYLIDAGDGVTRQLANAGITEPELSVLFLTHLHDDHTAGLPALMTFFHTLRGRELTLIGPPQTQQLLTGTLAYMNANAEIRMAERTLLAPQNIFAARDVGEGMVFSDNNVNVYAITNTHYHLAGKGTAARNKSYAYRFETSVGVVVFTGDTGPSEAVEKLATNADILVAEMVSAGDIAQIPKDVARHMLEEHLSAADVGRLAAKANIGKLVLSHIRNVADSDVAEIRRYFSGPIIVGKDLDVIELSRGKGQAQH